MPRGRKNTVRVSQVKEQPQGIVSILKRYESEISSFLGIVVALALAGILLFLIRRSLPNPSLVPAGQTSAPSEQTQTVTDNGQKYVVKSGQGLWQIAQATYRDGYKWKQIADANHLQSPYILKSGQELTLPVIASPTPAETTITVVPEATPVTPLVDLAKGSPMTVTQGSTYVVKKGDYLWRIAIAAYGDGYKWTKIYEANKDKIKQPSYIEIGWQLVIPTLE